MIYIKCCALPCCVVPGDALVVRSINRGFQFRCNIVAPVVSDLLFRLAALVFCSATRSSDSVVPWIATELSVGALLIVVAIFWTTLDLGQRHDDIPSLQNYQEWMNVIKEKEYQIFGGW